MAKRKRLSPTSPIELSPEGANSPELGTKSVPPNGWVGVRTPRNRAPIADVAGDVALQSAFAEVSGELQNARDRGLLVQSLPLSAIDKTHLVRDRLAVEDDEMQTLIDSLRDRGQQAPIEVVSLGSDRYGLISGWRRLMALRRLNQEEPDRDDFATIKALIRKPAGAADAYLSMVEENEVRADLSFYERARIAVKAAEQGVYESPKHAVKALFASARRAKRSKILSFTELVEGLDAHLSFPSSISEKLGLALVGAMRSRPGFYKALVKALVQAAPLEDAGSERKLLEQILRSATSPSSAAPEREKIAKGLQFSAQAGRVVLSGPLVDERLIVGLRDWLKRQT